LTDNDLESRDLVISFKMPLNIDSLKTLDIKEMKLKKTEMKRIEKE
jgi:hypothetical protein